MVVTTLSLILLLITLAGTTRLTWWFTVLDFFRLQYAVFGLIFFIWAVAVSNWPAAVIDVAIIALNLYRIRKFWPKFPQKKTDYRNKTVLSVNAFKDNRDFAALRKEVRDADADLLLLMEMTDQLEDELADVLASYDYRLQTPVRDGFSICLLSKSELFNEKISYHGNTETPLLQVQTELNGKIYQIYSTHPKPALSKGWYEERHTYFHEIESVIGDADYPVIVMGDFNSVPWEDHFETFLSRTGLQSTIEGHGYHVTWPVYMIPGGIPMDHILISRGETFSDMHIGPFVGSDHYPISINLTMDKGT